MNATNTNGDIDINVKNVANNSLPLFPLPLLSSSASVSLSVSTDSLIKYQKPTGTGTGTGTGNNNSNKLLNVDTDTDVENLLAQAQAEAEAEQQERERIGLLENTERDSIHSKLLDLHENDDDDDDDDDSDGRNLMSKNNNNNNNYDGTDLNSGNPNAAPDDPPIHKGYMYKKGDWTGKMKKRMFVLEKCILKYYEHGNMWYPYGYDYKGEIVIDSTMRIYTKFIPEDGISIGVLHPHGSTSATKLTAIANSKRRINHNHKDSVRSEHQNQQKQINLGAVSGIKVSKVAKRRSSFFGLGVQKTSDALNEKSLLLVCIGGVGSGDASLSPETIDTVTDTEKAKATEASVSKKENNTDDNGNDKDDEDDHDVASASEIANYSKKAKETIALATSTISDKSRDLLECEHETDVQAWIDAIQCHLDWKLKKDMEDKEEWKANQNNRR